MAPIPQIAAFLESDSRLRARRPPLGLLLPGRKREPHRSGHVIPEAVAANRRDDHLAPAAGPEAGGVTSVTSPVNTIVSSG